MNRTDYFVGRVLHALELAGALVLLPVLLVLSVAMFAIAAPFLLITSVMDYLAKCYRIAEERK